MRRPSTVTVALVAVASALAVVGNVAASSLGTPSAGATPWIWAAFVLLVVASLVIELYRRLSDKPTPVPGDLGRTAAQLAVAVGRQCHVDAELWQVFDPYPLPVRFAVDPDAPADHWANIRRAAPGTDPGPLDLAGSLADVADVYGRVPSGRLVLLGRAGAGKTILASRLVAELIDRRQPDDPIPVVFNLSGWNPGAADLYAWLATRLVRDYPHLAEPGPAGATLAAELVTSGRVLPVLDGFDEMAPNLRTAALRGLNRTTTPLVLSSRPDEYAAAVAASDVLTGAAVLSLAPLTVAELTTYLTRATPPGRTSRGWASVLDSGEASAVTEVLSTPLMLYLARTIYSDRPDRDPADLLNQERYPTPGDLEEHLLDAFVPAVYARAGNREAGPGRARPWDDPDDALRWHRFLARHLRRLDTHDVAWWRLPESLPRWLPVVTSTLFGFLVGFTSWTSMVGQVHLGLAWGGLSALMFGILGALVGTLEPQRAVLQLRGHLGDLPWAAGIGLMGGLVTGVGAWLVSRLLDGFNEDLGPYLAVGLSLGIAVAALALVNMLRVTPPIEAAPSPMELLRFDRQYATGLFVAGALAGGCTFAGITIVGDLFVEYGRLLQVLIGVGVGVACGLGFALIYVYLGTAWSGWLLYARLCLPLLGRLPWPILEFLADAHRRGVLRQTGGVWRYRHVRLRDQLAADRP